MRGEKDLLASRPCEILVDYMTPEEREEYEGILSNAKERVLLLRSLHGKGSEVLKILIDYMGDNEWERFKEITRSAAKRRMEDKYGETV